MANFTITPNTMTAIVLLISVAINLALNLSGAGVAVDCQVREVAQQAQMAAAALAH